MNEEKSPFRFPVFVFFVTLFSLMLVRVINADRVDAVEKEGMKMLEYLFDVVISAISSAVITAVSYFGFLRKMPDKITEKVTANLQAKLDPSNAVLKEEHRSISDKLDYTNQFLQTECRDMRKGIDSLVAKEKLDELRYRSLDCNQRDIVDAVRKMDGLANQMMLLVEKNTALLRENKMLKDELQKVRHQERYAEHPFADYEFEP